MNLPPSVWDQPGGIRPAEPLLVGLANAVKGIREFGMAVSFRETIGIEVCVNCVDAQSALAYGPLPRRPRDGSWPLQEGARPAILNRIKTQALENVIVKGGSSLRLGSIRGNDGLPGGRVR